MDIAEPLSTFKQLLELRLQCSLAEHQFFLQDSIPVSSGGYLFITLRDVSYKGRWFWTTIRYGPMTTAYMCWTTGNGF